MFVKRKEFKFIISKEAYLRIQRMLSAVMEPDEYGSNGSYMVRSQYYDSINDSSLRDNLDGVLEKRKIRVRIYSAEADTAKLEYKCKNGADGIKYSIPLTRQEALTMEKHRYDFLLDRNEELALRLYIRLTEHVFFPKTIVEYERTAYKYPVSNVRITFDCNLKGSINPYGIFEKELSYVPLLSPDKGILEIKYNDFFPYALKSLIGTIDSVAEAYSKYSMSRLKYI